MLDTYLRIQNVEKLEVDEAGDKQPLLWRLECFGCSISLGEHSSKCPPDFRVLRSPDVTFKASKKIAECLLRADGDTSELFLSLEPGHYSEERQKAMSDRDFIHLFLSRPPVFNTIFCSRGAREGRWKTSGFQREQSS